jgi:hypothetical protein
MKTGLRISAKSLGELALPDFCPRCFWIKTNVGKLPFQIFPGILGSIDSYIKKIVHCYFDEANYHPSWLNELGPLTGYIEPPHYSKFQFTDKDSNATLWGTPDGILTKADGSYLILDYKTAKYTGVQDKLMPMYEVQLNAYAAIGARCAIHPVSGLALVYMEPRTEGDAGLYVSNNRNYGFDMGFYASVHRIELKPDLISKLLATASNIYSLRSAPERRQGCKDCACLDDLMAIADARSVGHADD